MDREKGNQHSVSANSNVIVAGMAQKARRGSVAAPPAHRDQEALHPGC